MKRLDKFKQDVASAQTAHEVSEAIKNLVEKHHMEVCAISPATCWKHTDCDKCREDWINQEVEEGEE